MQSIRTLKIAFACLLASSLSSAVSGNDHSDKQSHIPQQVHANVGSSQMTFVDPKTGRLLWKANVQEFQAASNSSGAVIGTMHSVDGTLYESGKPADSIIAPVVIADNGNHIVTATGGVRIKSLTQASTTLTCDKVVWYTTHNSMIGSGHVVFKTGGFTQSGPSFLADTKMKNVVMPAPGGANSHSIHVVFQHP